MTRKEYLQPSYPSFNNTDSFFNEYQDLFFNFSPKFITTNSSDMSLISDSEAIFSDQFIDFRVHDDELNIMDDFSLDLDEIDTILGCELEGKIRSFGESEKVSSPHQRKLPIDEEDQQSDVSMDNSLALVHLVKAYGEAMEKEQTELAQVIIKCISEKVSPIGETMERLLYYLFQPSDKNLNYLRQESAKNFLAAFKAFYQLLPYGKFAGFAANRAILEAITRDVEIIHIVDFDIGEGTQWSSLIENLGCREREIKLTSIRWPDSCESTTWRSEATKRRLLDHARIFGLNLDMEEVEFHKLESEIKRLGGRNGGRRELLVFNCMVGLPHMGRVRSMRHVLEFLKVGKEYLLYHSAPNTKGIITFGNGDSWEVLRNCCGFSSFLDGCVLHYQALLESMECAFPSDLGDARSAIECLFVSPFVSRLTWIRKWEERKMLCEFQSSFGLQSQRVSKESLLEAKEMVSCPYAVVLEGEGKNEMVLKWRGAELVRVSFWTS